jgi:hypothetical protein
MIHKSLPLHGEPPRRWAALVVAANAAILLALGAAAGCGGGTDEASEPLRDGVYAYELTEEYLLENGIPSAQAENESGMHEATLAGGEFVDRWQTAEGRTGSCRGTYEGDGNRVTFRWESGCFGDWAMSYSVEGDVVTWDDVEALPPHDGDEEQKVAEVFNGVPWTRIGESEES